MKLWTWPDKSTSRGRGFTGRGKNAKAVISSTLDTDPNPTRSRDLAEFSSRLEFRIRMNFPCPSAEPSRVCNRKSRTRSLTGISIC